MNGVTLIAKAADFAARAHATQHRKGVAKEPYVNHLAEVALLVAEATGGGDAALIAAAWLHDTVEDTPTTREDLVDLFGADVAELVAQVTDDKSLPKAERKRLQVAHMPEISARAQLLKMADKISNVRAVGVSPPAGWDEARLRDYVAWAEEVVRRATVTNTYLTDAFARAAADAREAIATKL